MKCSASTHEKLNATDSWHTMVSKLMLPGTDFEKVTSITDLETREVSNDHVVRVTIKTVVRKEYF